METCTQTEVRGSCSRGVDVTVELIGIVDVNVDFQTSTVALVVDIDVKVDPNVQTLK